MGDNKARGDLRLELHVLLDIMVTVLSCYSRHMQDFSINKYDF